MALRAEYTVDKLNSRSGDNLPGWFSMKVLDVAEGRLTMEYMIRPQFLAPNGFLHAASVIALADTAAGYATIAHLPAGAANFTTIELKSNFIGTATEGRLRALATGVHLGRTTQVWDAVVTHVESGKTIALFRNTQLVIWPRTA